MGINHAVVLVEDQIPIIECGGCMETIDQDTAECSCWDKACTRCMKMLANCKLSKACGWDQIVLLEDLPKETQNEILGSTTHPSVQTIPKGAGNTDQHTGVKF